MNPIAVSVTPGKVVFPGVAEAAAAGSAVPSSIADLFCQMLAAAQAGVAPSVEQSGDCTDGECTMPDDTPAASIDAAVLAATTVPVPLAATTVSTITTARSTAAAAPVSDRNLVAGLKSSLISQNDEFKPFNRSSRSNRFRRSPTRTVRD